MNAQQVVTAASSAAQKSDGSKIGQFQTFLCGGVAGCMSRTFTAPLDVTKIIFQLSASGPGAGGYGSFGGALKTIFKEEGISGLWKGNVVACLRLGPYSAIKYFVFENTKDYFADADGNTPAAKRAVCGALSGSCAVLSTYPLDLVKTRLTLQKEGVGLDGTVYKKTYNGTIDCLKKVSRDEGFGSLFKGLSPTLQGVIPFEAIQFTFYNWIKNLRADQKLAAAKAKGQSEESAKLQTFDFLVLGCVAGAVAQTGAYPFDLIRKRFMAASKAEGMLKTEYKGTLDAFKQIIKEEGALGLYKGTVPNLLKVCPYAAIMWATYEQMRRLMQWTNANGYNPARK
jgi:hypothetical protein